MGREKSLRTRVKEARQLASASEYGKQLGDFKGQARKPLDVSLKEHVEKFIDNLKVGDVIELTAWLGLAYTIKPILDSAEEIHVKMKYIKIVTGRVPFWETIKMFPMFPMPQIAEFVAATTVQLSEEEKKSLEQTDWQTWLLALAISALIIKFGPSILESLGGVTKIGTLLLQ